MKKKNSINIAVQDNHTPNPNYTLIGISTHFLPPPELATRPDRRP